MIRRSFEPAQSECRGGDRVQRERALEVRPSGQGALGRAPICDDAVALDRRAAPAWEAKALADHEVGAGKRALDVAVVERAIGDARIGLDGGFRVEHWLERLVFDVDQLERVLGEVAVARDNDGDRLAHVARRLVGGREVRDRRSDSCRKRPRELRDVRSREHADDTPELECRRRIEPRDARVCER